MNDPKPKPSLLLIEPDYMLRHTVALTARSTGLAVVHEAASLGTAEQMLRSDAYDGLLLALGTDGEALALIDRLRAGQTASAAGAPIAVMVNQVGNELAQKLIMSGVNQIVVRPFKVKTLLNTIRTLAA